MRLSLEMLEASSLEISGDDNIPVSLKSFVGMFMSILRKMAKSNAECTGESFQMVNLQNSGSSPMCVTLREAREPHSSNISSTSSIPVPATRALTSYKAQEGVNDNANGLNCSRK